MTTTKQYDLINRLLSISSSASALIKSAYHYNSANQRDTATLADNSYWTYGYDTDGQVNSGKKRFTNGTWVPGEQFTYTQDDIGIRSATAMGGDSAGGSLRSATYTPNNLNQYSSRTNPESVDVIGNANAESTVTVNSQSTYRKSEFFQAAVTVVNTSPAYPQMTTTASLGGTNATRTGYVFVPPSTENYGYDLDGNTTSDGRWTYTWDAENRPIQMIANSNVPDSAKRKLVFEYDWLGRRIRKQVYIYSGGAYPGTPNTDTKYVCDGWNLLAELNASNGLIRTYTWGIDLSGSRQGAGGVGGLLMVKPASSNPAFVAYDGNGNVSGLVDATSGATLAQYEYGPFGELIRANGSYATQNPFRFSTKYADDESDLVYYGYRYYSPSTGRWVGRDPVEESGGINLYGFVDNDSISRSDYIGLCCGAFVITQVKDPPVPEDQFKGAGGKDHLDGFKLSFIGCNACDCEPGKIRLIQATKANGGTGHNAAFDSAREPRLTAGGGIDYPPYGGVKGPEWPLSLIDAPNNANKFWGETTFTIDVCAVCKGRSGDKVLACASFTFGDVSRKVNVPTGKPLLSEDVNKYGATAGKGSPGNYGFMIPCSDSPGPIFTAAEKKWRSSL